MATDAEGNILESWTVYTGNPKVGNSALSISTTSKDYANAQLINVSSATATGGPYVDFVWKNLAMQPNDFRVTSATVTGAAAAGTSATITAATSTNGVATYTATNTFVTGQAVTITGVVGGSYNKALLTVVSATSALFTVADPTLAGTYTSGGTATGVATVGYTAANSFVPGQVVTITGLSTSAFNLSAVFIGYASPTGFTVVNAASGSTVTGATGLAILNFPTALVTAVSSLTYPNYVTFTTSAAHGFLQGQNVIISGIPTTPVGALGSSGNPLNLINANIDAVPSSTTFSVQSNLTAVLTGLSSSVTATSLTGASPSAGFVTIATTTPPPVGSLVTISGVATTTAYNGTYTVYSVVAGTSFTIQSTVTGTATGTIVFVNNQVIAQTSPENTTTINGAQNFGWSNTSTVPPALLDFTKGYHNIIGGNYSGYPNFKAADPILNVTGATGNGSTIVFTAQSIGFVPGSLSGVSVTVSGMSNSAFNGTFTIVTASATVVSNTAYTFTVTSSAGSGVTVTGQTGLAQLYAGASDTQGALIVGGLSYVTVPTLLGLATAVAQAALVADELLTTVAAGATNTATQPTGVNVTDTATATVTIAGGTATWPVGTKVTIAAGTGIPAAVVGTWFVTGGSGSTLVITGSGWTVANSGAITPGTVLTGTSGTIKTQSIAAGTLYETPGQAITITPWA